MCRAVSTPLSMTSELSCRRQRWSDRYTCTMIDGEIILKTFSISALKQLIIMQSYFVRLFKWWRKKRESKVFSLFFLIIFVKILNKIYLKFFSKKRWIKNNNKRRRTKKKMYLLQKRIFYSNKKIMKRFSLSLFF